MSEAAAVINESSPKIMTTTHTIHNLKCPISLFVRSWHIRLSDERLHEHPRAVGSRHRLNTARRYEGQDTGWSAG